MDPCVLIHYSNANIREVSLLDALRSPIFMEYYKEQPFNDNLLRPCPLLENSGMLTDMVNRSGAHSSDLEEQETAEEYLFKWYWDGSIANERMYKHCLSERNYLCKNNHVRICLRANR